MRFDFADSDLNDSNNNNSDINHNDNEKHQAKSAVNQRRKMADSEKEETINLVSFRRSVHNWGAFQRHPIEHQPRGHSGETCQVRNVPRFQSVVYLLRAKAVYIRVGFCNRAPSPICLIDMNVNSLIMDSPSNDANDAHVFAQYACLMCSVSHRFVASGVRVGASRGGAFGAEESAHDSGGKTVT